MPSKSQVRYPENWSDIALDVKQSVDWRCSKCRLQCIRPRDDTSKISRSLRMALTLTVHHKNFLPEDNRRSNLYEPIPLMEEYGNLLLNGVERMV
ncbi:HNH endonuclease [Nostoc sp.]|uniref:HNH endonuclease n=1 Tax=Nostoc sp. TaxID=1180 RepID=UPI002FFA7E31